MLIFFTLVVVKLYLHLFPEKKKGDLLLRLENGDLSVKSTLIERNLRLVVYIARKFENTGIGIEDLVSIGTIGLIKAVNTFDPTKKLNWLLMPLAV